MLIDWFTICAQAINFLILVWLMKRFLYKPILHAIDARENLIATELADAAAKKTEAQKDRDEFQHKNEEFDKHASHSWLEGNGRSQRSNGKRHSLDEAAKCGRRLGRQAAELLRIDAQNLRNQAISATDPAGRLCHREKALGDLATVESGGTPGRGVYTAIARDERQGKGGPRPSP